MISRFLTSIDSLELFRLWIARRKHLKHAECCSCSRDYSRLPIPMRTGLHPSTASTDCRRPTWSSATIFSVFLLERQLGLNSRSTTEDLISLRFVRLNGLFSNPFPLSSSSETYVRIEELNID